jgi:hypothetical protein
MENSILKSTKKVLGLADGYTAFDLDVLTHINAAFSVLNDLGVGPVGGYFVEDDAAEWSSLGLPQNQLSMVRTYIYLKTRMLFDPPTTSFLIDATNKQIEQLEWRLNVNRENSLNGEVV